MRGVVGALVVLATAAVGVPAASAGSTTSPPVRPRAATAVNNSWSWAVEVLPFGASPTPDDQAAYGLTGNCAGPDGLRSGSNPGHAPIRWGTGANFTFQAPADTSITRVTLWRYGVGRPGGGQSRAAPTTSPGASRRTPTSAPTRSRRSDAIRATASTRTRARSARRASRRLEDRPRRSRHELQDRDLLRRRQRALHRAATRTTERAARTASSISRVPWCTSRTPSHRRSRRGATASTRGGGRPSTPSPTTPRTAPASARYDSTSTATSSPRQKCACDYTRPVPCAGPRARRPLLRQRHRRRRAHRTARGRGRVAATTGSCSARSESTARRRPPSSSVRAARRSCSR